jgi:EAL domain-containing protein (putative c-di-GMP-specific phosphodiesterase class I)
MATSLPPSIPLTALADAGVGVALDDFGVGYSSLAYLAGLPVSASKIDRSFIHGLSSPSRTFDVVAAVVELAHGLELRVIAGESRAGVSSTW